MDEISIDELFSNSIPTAERIKDALTAEVALLHTIHNDEIFGNKVTARYTSFIDKLLTTLFDSLSKEFKIKDKTALAALGGYGRSELNIHSDIDLTLIYKKKLTKDIEALTEKMLYILWDTGLDVGFSLRSVKDCIKLAGEDTKTKTSLLDARLLTGDADLLETLLNDLEKKQFTPAKTEQFIAEKITETKERHEKYGGSIYILEPNIKEGEGGLRDIHIARWIIQAKNKTTEPDKEIIKLLSPTDLQELRDATNFLLWVRDDIHLNTDRKGDQLSFDHQERIAKELGLKNTTEALAVESFMQSYYRHASRLSRLSALLISLTMEGEGAKKVEKKPVALDSNYTLTGDAVSINDPDIYLEDLEAMIKAFEYSMPKNRYIDPVTRDAILRNTSRIDDNFRTSESVRDSFKTIVSGRTPYKPLAEMHRLKFLGRFIPEFKGVIYRVQHDRYHVFTVDAHTLFAVRELERLYGIYKNEHYLLSSLLEEIERPDLLTLGILLHDIGKAHGKGHAETGAKMVKPILERLGFDEHDIKTVTFLVRQHLIIADTAQYRDIHDGKLIIDFAKTVKTIPRLKMLLLLTFADVRAVGPDVWSQWKGALFQELFFKVLLVIERGNFELEESADIIERVKGEVKELLVSEEPWWIEEYYSLLPLRYFISNIPAHIVGHITALKKLSTAEQDIVMDIRQDIEGDYTELSICTYDVVGLFSMITGVMAANSTNILDAQINTLRNGVALDILRVKNAFGEHITDEKKLKDIEEDLRRVITGTIKVDKLVARQRPSILDNKPTPQVQTRIEIDNEVSETYTVIDIHTEDRIGLLYKISSALTSLGVYIVIAKITTKGDAATDIFYVNDIFGQKIYFKDRLSDITEALFQKLSGVAPPKPNNGNGAETDSKENPKDDTNA